MMWKTLRFSAGDLNDAPNVARRSIELSGLIKRSFSLAGHRTSVALEKEFWTVLARIAETRAQSLSALVAAADAGRGPDQPLASALRVMALLADQAGADQAGTDQAGADQALIDQ